MCVYICIDINIILKILNVLGVGFKKRRILIRNLRKKNKESGWVKSVGAFLGSKEKQM